MENGNKSPNRSQEKVEIEKEYQQKTQFYAQKRLHNDQKGKCKKIIYFSKKLFTKIWIL